MGDSTRILSTSSVPVPVSVDAQSLDEVNLDQELWWSLLHLDALAPARGPGQEPPH